MIKVCSIFIYTALVLQRLLYKEIIELIEVYYMYIYLYYIKHYYLKSQLTLHLLKMPVFTANLSS